MLPFAIQYYGELSNHLALNYQRVIYAIKGSRHTYH